MSDCKCYHCGQPVPDGVELPVTIAGESRAMCCVGCQGVAKAIVDNGLDSYYRNRDALPESQREAKPAILDELALFDHAEFQSSFVKALGESEREASLLLEGITCSACIWLNEQHIARQPGVIAVNINYATRRARVRWDDSRTKLSEILTAVAAIGYRAHPYDAARNEEVAGRERRDALWRLWVAGFGMMQVMMYAFPVYIANGDMTPDIENVMRWASLVLTLPVMLYSAAPFFKRAWRDVRLGRVGMDVPVALGVGAAFAASVWATLIQAGEVYFDSVTMFVFFLLGGRFLEMSARQKAVGVTEALAKLRPAFARRLANYPASHESEQIVVADLRVGDRIVVLAGETLPADGEVLEGESSINEALLTGESYPVRKVVGSEVIGGAVNIESPLIIKVTEVGEETKLSSIVRLMERASMDKPHVVELADQVAARFVGALLVTALLAAIGWYWVDPEKVLWITVSVLVVTCPCALSLATPVALTVAAGAFAKAGLLVTKANAIETLSKATHFVFDKTGTLTTGRMSMQSVEVVNGGQLEEIWSVVASLERSSEHPIGKALFAAALAKGRKDELVSTDLRNQPGDGVEGTVGGKSYRLGRPEFVAELVEQPCPANLSTTDGDTTVALGREGEWLAFFGLGDTVRTDAAALVSDLTAANCQVTLLSGDSQIVVTGLASKLSIANAIAQARPEDKHRVVKQLQEKGAVVAMVGDGVNDAPVLAQAQVSIAMGGGAHLARTQADFVLLTEELRSLSHGVGLARLTLRIIKQNLWWSFAYNFVALPLAIMGFVTPWLAGIGMSASSILVVLNSLRIQRVAR